MYIAPDKGVLLAGKKNMKWRHFRNVLDVFHSKGNVIPIVSRGDLIND
jgi:hypothetical protein